MGNLVKRIISALVLLPPVVFVIFKGGCYINVLVGLVVVLCSIEYFKMLGFVRTSLIISVFLTLLGYIGLIIFPLEYVVFVLIVVLTLAGIYVLLSIREIKGSSVRLSYLFSGIIYLGFFPAFIPLIRNYSAKEGFYYLLMFLAVIWLSDTFAYFVGRSLGRHKLYEKVSPNKTIEGSIGGIVGGLVGVCIVSLLFSKSPSMKLFIFVGVVVNIVGQLGDLFESMFKRDVGIKDSGSLIPGHGGMLDRVDAIIFAAPTMYLLLRFVL
ncbi:MAG: phosphatidate cytidylyltransferase [Deltaproteobacteria bacterium]|nr:phosphatidate cytidylyltransferase [Deltaproteobacteria bacterium]